MLNSRGKKFGILSYSEREWNASVYVNALNDRLESLTWSAPSSLVTNDDKDILWCVRNREQKSSVSAMRLGLFRASMINSGFYENSVCDPVVFAVYPHFKSLKAEPVDGWCVPSPCAFTTKTNTTANHTKPVNFNILVGSKRLFFTE